MIILKYILFFLPVLYLFYHVYSYFFTKVPIIKTPKNYYQELLKNFTIPENSIIYELGCGQGDFLFLAEKFKPKKIVGVELALFHYIFTKIKAKLKKSNIEFLRQDFFTIKLQDADFIYLFLVQPVVIKLWEKIKKECKPGTIVIVLCDKIPNENPIKIVPTRPNKEKTTFYNIYQI